MNPETRFEVNEELVAAKVMDGEVVMINLSTGSYYTSNDVTGALWPLIEQRGPLAAMVELLCSRYDVGPAQAAADLERLLRHLEAENIIRPARAAVSASPSAEGGPKERQPYRAPTVEVFRDMAQLLALDPPMPDVGDIPWRRADDGPRE
ncbi:MAG TPA: PqqD family protein [Candidatus Methylomirabilis sp.]|nr:PqqD family protein [Candidatus Methylomirabilis sp.]